ncbi:unnamed protein product [Polarella glacialis]|uniref:Methyltransferase FkbM domain-containing protein n=1 Tax=Polarella glacialis TaxID=89957 RepID=A0A813GQ74_POLGL|nr:unnamed protein product [Polarella glacialis]
MTPGAQMTMAFGAASSPSATRSPPARPQILRFPVGAGEEVPDLTSGVSCVENDHGGLPNGTTKDLLCVLSLRQRGKLLSSRGSKRRSPMLSLQGTLAAELESFEVTPSSSSSLGGATLSFGVRSRHAEIWHKISAMTELEVHLGRLRFAALATISSSRGSTRVQRDSLGCARDALVAGIRRCSKTRGSAADGQLLVALTLAILDHRGALPGVQEATRLWVEAYSPGNNEYHHSLLAKLDAAGFEDVFHLGLHGTTGSWAAAQASHPKSREMGSFIAPSQSHPRGFALPWDLATDALPGRSKVKSLQDLLAGRKVDLLVLHSAARREWLKKGLAIAAAMVNINGAVCIEGVPSRALSGVSGAAKQLGFSEITPPVAATSAQLCFAVSPSGSAPPSLAAKVQSPLLLDKSSSLGLHLQGSVPVADLDGGQLIIPRDSKVWIEVGCNNWEMLLDELPRDGSVELLTFEPLVDKFAYLRTLSGQSPHHKVFPFAIAPKQMGNFVSIRSQNYSNFRGAPGRSFQESGASSLLPYAENYKDHRWDGATGQYQFFREYLVPAVPLEWVVSILLGGREVDFLKVDAQGMDYEIFASLGSHARKVHRAQMELHTHVRHSGETACPDVVDKMQRLHGFRVLKGGCKSFDSATHDEVCTAP